MLLEVLPRPDLTWLLTGVIGLLTFIVVKHLLKVRSLPPGPFPLPLLGNILAFRGKSKTFVTVMNEMREKYKDIFTVWLGNQPSIVVCNYELTREALITKRNDFSGRVKRSSTQLFLNGNEDVIFGDFGPCWETLRKILTNAARKYSVSEKLAELVVDVVDRSADLMVKEGKPVDANSYLYLMLYNVLASSAFGKRFEMDDPEFLGLRKTNDDMNEKFGNGLPSDAVPILKYVYRKQIKEVVDLIRKFIGFIEKNFYEHKATYKKGVVRDFTDAVLESREEAKAEGKDSFDHLTDGNLIMLVNDFFSAGTDTTRITLCWTLLLICENLEVQKKMQEEIDENIGSRPPIQSDKTVCPYTYAVITEVLRFRPVIDFSLEHKTICNTELGGYKIPKDTACLFHINGPHMNENYWEEPEKFKPERFLESDGSFTNSRLTGYLPFSLGRRACPGEKLALADVFLIITRLLQKHSFQLENGPGSADLEPQLIAFSNCTKEFKVIVNRR